MSDWAKEEQNKQVEAMMTPSNQAEFPVTDIEPKPLEVPERAVIDVTKEDLEENDKLRGALKQANETAESVLGGVNPDFLGPNDLEDIETMRRNLKELRVSCVPSWHIGDKVVYPGCGGVGEVLRVRHKHSEDDDNDEEGWQEVFVQWPDSGREYVKPSWDKSSRLEAPKLSPEEATALIDKYLGELPKPSPGMQAIAEALAGPLQRRIRERLHTDSESTDE